MILPFGKQLDVEVREMSVGDCRIAIKIRLPARGQVGRRGCAMASAMVRKCIGRRECVHPFGGCESVGIDDMP